MSCRRRSANVRPARLARPGPPRNSRTHLLRPVIQHLTGGGTIHHDRNDSGMWTCAMKALSKPVWPWFTSAGVNAWTTMSIAPAICFASAEFVSVCASAWSENTAARFTYKISYFTSIKSYSGDVSSTSRTKRKPMWYIRFSLGTLDRFASRAYRGPVCQAPPRMTERLQPVSRTATALVSSST